MLDHSGWASILPRKITPSDGDMILDNNGKILYVELSSRFCRWADLSEGQHRLYRNLLHVGPSAVAAILAHHAIPAEGVPINTVADIVEFTVMKLGEDGLFEYSPRYPGAVFPLVVKKLLGF
jgi:hypothetical protein